MPRIRTIIPGVDPKLLIKDAARMLPDPTRRLLLRGGLSLGALAVLGGCDIVDSDAAEGVLRKVSAFNDWAQARLSSRRGYRHAPNGHPARLRPSSNRSELGRPASAAACQKHTIGMF